MRHGLLSLHPLYSTGVLHPLPSAEDLQVRLYQRSSLLLRNGALSVNVPSFPHTTELSHLPVFPVVRLYLQGPSLLLLSHHTDGISTRFHALFCVRQCVPGN